MCFYFSFFYINSAKSKLKKINEFIWDTFENHWDLLVPECPKRGEKETNILLIKLL